MRLIYLESIDAWLPLLIVAIPSRPHRHSAHRATHGAAVQLEEVDADKGIDGAKSMLGGLAIALGISCNAS